jgi:cell wall-associated NlpC family hydrolase
VVARRLALLPAHRLDSIETQTAGYSRYPTGEALRKWCSAELEACRHPQPGDVVLFTTGSDPQHLGLQGNRSVGLSLIHAYALRPRRVVETIFDDSWQRRVVGVFSFPGL